MTIEIERGLVKRRAPQLSLARVAGLKVLDQDRGLSDHGVHHMWGMLLRKAKQRLAQEQQGQDRQAGK